ncbi:MAG TPA: hypothetical protein VFW73_00700 [Lacipirellulaceae bacterium]|nr:hypothetical protein [Lacipirellulaceae bacterium]
MMRVVLRLVAYTIQWVNWRSSQAAVLSTKDPHVIPLGFQRQEQRVCENQRMPEAGLRTREVYQVPFVRFEVPLLLGPAAMPEVGNYTLKQGVSLGTFWRFRPYWLATRARPADKNPVARRPLDWLS